MPWAWDGRPPISSPCGLFVARAGSWDGPREGTEHLVRFVAKTSLFAPSQAALVLAAGAGTGVGVPSASQRKVFLGRRGPGQGLQSTQLLLTFPDQPGHLLPKERAISISTHLTGDPGSSHPMSSGLLESDAKCIIVFSSTQASLLSFLCSSTVASVGR